MFREVKADVPTLTPPGVAAEVSPTTAFCASTINSYPTRGIVEMTHLVQSDVSQIANLLNLGTSQLERPQIPQVQVVVRSVRDHLVIVLHQ